MRHIRDVPLALALLLLYTGNVVQTLRAEMHALQVYD
jgi:hypothetical protein